MNSLRALLQELLDPKIVTIATNCDTGEQTITTRPPNSLEIRAAKTIYALALELEIKQKQSDENSQNLST